MSSNTPRTMSISPHLEYISTSESFKLVECSSLTILIYSWIQLPKSKSPSWAQAECTAKMSIWGVFENNVDLSACVNVETLHLSLQQGLEVDGNIYLYLPQGIEKYVNGRTYIKKKRRAVEYAGIYIKKGTHYMRIYTRRNYLLWEKLCHGKCQLNKFSLPRPTMHDNLHKKYQPKEYTIWKRCLRAFKLDFGKSTSKNSHINLYIHCVKGDFLQCLCKYT